MKLRFKIVVANILMLIIGWYSSGIISQRYADKVIGENWFDKIMTVIAYTAFIYISVLLFITILSLLGAIISKLLKKRESLIGFLISLIVNLVVILIVVFLSYLN